MKKLSCSTFGLLALLAGSASAANITALTSFGGGDGWLAPGEGGYPYLTTGNTERGLAYNPVTGNLLLVSRANPTGTDGSNIRILNAATGVDIGALDKGTGVVSGGTFAVNTVGVSQSGAIFVSNLTTNGSTSPFKVYGWANEAATATVAASFTTTGAFRLGDDLDVTGSGAGTLIAAGYGANTGAPDVLLLSTVDGASFTGSDITTSSTVPGNYRLGITFAGGTTIFGSQGINVAANQSPKILDYSNPPSFSELSLSNITTERAMDYTVVGGIPLLATLETANSLVRVYDLSSGTPVLFDSANLTTSFTANSNGAGAVAFGAVSGLNVNLYALNTNNGIQAFAVTVPEPSASLLAIAGLGLLLRRRR